MADDSNIFHNCPRQGFSETLNIGALLTNWCKIKTKLKISIAFKNNKYLGIILIKSNNTFQQHLIMISQKNELHCINAESC